MTDGVVVVGYGNTLRTDDGVGWRVAERLADDPRLAGVAVLRRHQLTPDLALDISEAELVVFVDASTGPAPGSFAIERVGRDDAATISSHRLSPAGLVALADALYGRAADVLLVSCGVDSFDAGDRLSPVVEAALPWMADAIVELVAPRVRDGGNG